MLGRICKEICLLIRFDGAGLLVLALLASFDSFKVVSDRMGEVESYWVCLTKVTK